MFKCRFPGFDSIKPKQLSLVWRCVTLLLLLSAKYHHSISEVSFFHFFAANDLCTY